MSEYPGYKINIGLCPELAKGKSVRVLIRRKEKGHHIEQGPWPADGKGACNWALSAPARDEESRKAYPFDIVAWKLAE